MKEQKIWGETEELERNPFVSVHRAEIKAGYRCSIHHHAYRTNGFFVASGQLLVVEYDERGLVTTTHAMRSGDWCTVPPNVPHRFECVDDAVVLEVYWLAPLGKYDIVRKDVGGKIGEE